MEQIKNEEQLREALNLMTYEMLINTKSYGMPWNTAKEESIAVVVARYCKPENKGGAEGAGTA